jgi:hypothetical protein
VKIQQITLSDAALSTIYFLVFGASVRKLFSELVKSAPMLEIVFSQYINKYINSKFRKQNFKKSRKAKYNLTLINRHKIMQMPVQYFYFFSLSFILSSFQAGVQIFFTKITGHFKTLGARRLELSKFDTEGPQILDAILQKLVTNPNRRERFVHSWVKKSYIP